MSGCLDLKQRPQTTHTLTQETWKFTGFQTTECLAIYFVATETITI